MKKLLTGTALALLASATVASAQEWSVSVGGFFRGGVGYIDIDDDNDDIGIMRDPEIIVRATLVADNGLTFGAETQFEGADSGERVDENFLFVSGSFGRFELGEQDGAADWAQYAGDVGSPWSRSGDGVGALFDGSYYGNNALNALNAYTADTSDALKITYYTPSISGFAAGVSYAPSTEQQARRSTRNDGQDAWEFGAQYENTFGEFELGLGVGYVIQSNDDDSIAVSGQVGYAGFAVGVAYSMTENAGFNGGDVDTMQVGASYATGPWTFGADVAFHLDEVGVTTAAGRPASVGIVGGAPAVIPAVPATVESAEQLGFSVGVAYALAPGVSIGVGGEYLDADVAGQDESIAVATWLGLRF